MVKYKHDFDSAPYLDDDEILSIYKDFNTQLLPDLIDNSCYYLGNNPTILKRVKDTSSGAPNWQIPVSYARKLVNTITGYMFKPGNIKYVVENEQDGYELNRIFDYNIEPVKTSMLGRLCSTYGVAYELHYIDGNNDSAERKFTCADNKEIIPIFDYNIEPVLKAFIRAYTIGGVVKLDVYYSDIIKKYEYNIKTIKLAKSQKDIRHPYKQPPLVIFKNNDEEISDFQPVKKLIDAYDILTSDSMNEFDRFAWAYLLMTEILSPEKLKEIKNLRVFQGLDNTQAVAFLTKEIPTGFISTMIDIVRFEIHNQSHVPNFIDVKTGEQISGVALDRLLYDFEFIAATKEAYFKQGLYQRIELLDKVINIGEDAELRNNIKIDMKRNKPTDKLADAQLYNQYINKGIPTRILIEQFASFVENPEAAMEEFAEEQSGAMELLPKLVTDEEQSDTAQGDTKQNMNAE